MHHFNQSLAHFHNLKKMAALMQFLQTMKLFHHCDRGIVQ